MTFADVRAAGEAGRFNIDNWIRVRGCLDFAVLVYGAPLAAIAADLDAFDARWPDAVPDDVAALFRSPGQFVIWRGNVLTALEAHAGRRALSSLAREADQTGWRRLQDLAAIHASGSQRNGLYGLAAQARKTRRALEDVDRAWAVTTQAQLTGHERNTFRNGIAALDAFHAVPAIAAAGLLPPPIGLLPHASPNERTPPPQQLLAALEAWIDEPLAPKSPNTARQALFAVSWGWRRGIALGLVNTAEDLPALASQTALETLRTRADPTFDGERIPNEKMRKAYVGMFAKVLAIIRP